MTIQATNASLTQTLQRIADKTGMQLEGLSGDERVFGKFGPGPPRDVISSLLNGTGYNIVMVGALANGAPRELMLSARSNAPLTPGAAKPEAPPADEDTPDGPLDDTQLPQGVQPPGRPIIGPGPNGQIRNPQEVLQQLRDQQQSQSQPPPQ